MELEKKLVHLRKEKGLTQLELSEALKVSRQAVSKWESGAAMPSTENLQCLSKLYGVSIDYLINAESPLQIEETHTGKRKNKKRGVYFVCALMALLIVVGVGTVMIYIFRNPESINLHMARSEDWNDLATDDILIQW